jgi:archaellum component FlaC
MKTKICVALIGIIMMGCFTPAFSQSQEAQQLLLNVEKLTQLKQILKDLYKGYEVVSKGYNTIKDISQGNFNLHKAFLDGLMEVSPAVKKYKRIVDIISLQARLVNEYKSAFSRFKKSNFFSLKEIDYMGGVYKNLFDKSLQSLDELLMVITANNLRMSDDERFAAIDKIFNDMEDKLSFLRNFNHSTTVLAMQRGKETIDTKLSQQLYGVH